MNEMFNTFDRTNKKPHNFPYFGVPQRYEEDMILQRHVEDSEFLNDFMAPTNYREVYDALENNVSAILYSKPGTGCTALLNNLREYDKNRPILLITSLSVSASGWLDLPVNENVIKQWLGDLVLRELINEKLFSSFLPSLHATMTSSVDRFWDWFVNIQNFIGFVKGENTNIWIFIDRPFFRVESDAQQWAKIVNCLIDLFQEFHNHKVNFIICGDGELHTEGILIYQPTYSNQHYETILKKRVGFVKKLFQMPVEIDISNLVKTFQEELGIGYIRKMLGGLRNDVHATIPIENGRGSSKIIGALQTFKRKYARSLPRITFEEKDIGGGIYINGYVLTALRVITGDVKSYAQPVEQIFNRRRKLDLIFKNLTDYETYDFDVIYPHFEKNSYFQKPDLDFALLRLVDRGTDFPQRKSMEIAENPAIKPATSLAIVHTGNSLREEVGAAYNSSGKSPFILHDIPAEEGCSGDPIISQDGKAIGLHCGTHADGGYSALTISAILNHLRTSENQDVKNFISTFRRK